MLETHYSLESLITTARKVAVDKKVVSFDLFDTLLIRRIHDPDLVKLPVARYISGLAGTVGSTVSWPKIQELRDSIEQQQRQKTGEKFADQEACYPVFMAELLRQLFRENYSDAILEKVTDYELSVENSMLVPRQILVQWMVELAEAGKRIFILSDMYLPASHLEKLVERAGFLHLVEAIISSADSFQAKASGEGYRLAAKNYNLEPQEWLHIGDNAHSDGLRAQEFGIDALIIHDPREDQRKAIVKRYYNYSDGKPFWRGRLLQQLMAPHEAENRKQPALYAEGYNFLGPLIGIFVQRIAELCRKENITKIFFLSREGWTFKRYWQEAMPGLYPLGGLPEVEYLYVSRMALAGASCAYQGLTKTNADIAFLPPGNRDFRDVCRIFSLDSGSFSEILDIYQLREDTCLSPIHEGYQPENRRRFEAMLTDDDFQDEVKKQTADTNTALQRYLEDVNFFDHQRVAIVDIGWLGTIQRFLFEAVAHREDVPQCIGYLFGATRGIPYPTSENNSVTGVMYDRNRFDLAASTLLYARDVFEEACRAPYPTLNGYRLDGDGYQLVFRQTDDEIGQAEIEQDGYFAPLQQGIFDSALRFSAASALLGYSFADYKPWVNYLLVNKLAFPSTAEVVRIRHQHHLDDFHGKKKPKADFKKDIKKTLWDNSSLRLRFDPLLRARSFFRHLRERINE
jgi:predicted HAD superfamily hydrolase